MKSQDLLQLKIECSNLSEIANSDEQSISDTVLKLFNGLQDELIQIEISVML